MEISSINNSLNYKQPVNAAKDIFNNFMEVINKADSSVANYLNGKADLADAAILIAEARVYVEGGKNITEALINIPKTLFNIQV